MSQKTVKFEIATPEKVVFKKEIKQVTVPTTSGEITVLPNHIPLISTLKPGVIEIKDENEEDEIISMAGGFIEVLREKIVILADTAERAQELDEERIKEAKTKAEEKKQEISDKDEVRFANISAQLDKEMARLKALTKWRNLKR
ncbi:MAG: ATP synthase F1 subunit epsilon [Patescibacteria group bacterium]|jgi:F-type H+-transporting ATPase subunit epsilon|nr:ATP synthase F1 subunit epsilon [Patescibacteria group bacterium]